MIENMRRQHSGQSLLQKQHHSKQSRKEKNASIKSFWDSLDQKKDHQSLSETTQSLTKHHKHAPVKKEAHVEKKQKHIVLNSKKIKEIEKESLKKKDAHKISADKMDKKTKDDERHNFMKSTITNHLKH